jgi:hypothetical protein
MKSKNHKKAGALFTHYLTLSRLSSLSLSLSLFLSLLGCTSNPVADSQAQVELSQIKPAFSETIYRDMIEKNSAGEAEYTGFYNAFEYKATALNASVRKALLDRESEYYQWDEAKISLERNKAEQEMANETSVFISFYTPDRRNDNLSDGKSIWRVLLDVGGKRYVGKIKRLRTLLAELQALYPYHTRWNTPYMVSFPVPTLSIDRQPLTLTITGPVGARTVNFPGSINAEISK